MPYGGTTPEQDKKIERCVADLVAKGKEKKNAISICKSSVLGKEHSEPTLMENVSLKFQSPISVVESIGNDENTRKIKGMALPAQESRNGRTYSLEDMKTARFAGKPFERGRELLIGLDHTDSVTDNVGRWIPTLEDTGIGFTGVAFNTGKHPYVTDMLDKKLMPFVSIEAMADLVKENDTVFAKNLDVLGMDFVKHPGMTDAHASLAEAFDKGIKEHSIKKEIGDDMVKEEKKIVEEEESPTEEEQPEETPVEEPEEEPKAEEKVEDSLIEKIFDKMDKKIDDLSKEVKELKEKPQSKGVVTEKEDLVPGLVIEKKAGGKVDIYSEDFNY